MHNFEGITSEMLHCGALIQISDESELAQTVEALLRDPERARLMGQAGLEMLRSKTGISAQIAPYLLDCFDRSFPRRPQPLLRRALYRVLARRWMRGAARRRANAERNCAANEPLPVPVVSIGGITVGGAGKTPLASHIASWLRAQGWEPAILTRGYHRRSTAEHILLGRGATMPAAYTGDEPRIFLRAGQANVGIGTKRYETAKLLLERFPETNILILDDGFQHARMPRDIDILVVDGMDPWGGGEPVPLGRLREPLDLLSRASIIVVNRAENDRRYQAIREGLRKYAGNVPVYRCHTNPVCWRDPMTNECIQDVPKTATAAFCGLGNPGNFWRTLDRLDIQPLFRWEFPDHHSYRPVEMQGLVRSAKAHGVKWLLTTEKDRNNLPEPTPSVVDGIRFAWLDIELVIDDDERFYRDLRERIEAIKLQRR
jgi:tetraacyldisaccharide 4'-kinase